MEIKEKKLSSKDRLFILPVIATSISLILLIFFLWPKIKEYDRVKTKYEQEQFAVSNFSSRWDEILQKENYYREIYANLQDISQDIGKSRNKIDYMKIFIDRSHTSRVKIISFSQSREEETDSKREITFQLNVNGQYKAIGNYIKYLESTYPIVDIQSFSITPKSTGLKTNNALDVQISGKIIFLI